MKCPNCKDGTLGYLNPENNSKFHIKCCYCGYETVIPQSEVYILIHSSEEDKPVQLISHYNSNSDLVEIFELIKKTTLDGEEVK